MWLSQPSELQFARDGGVAEPNISENLIPNQCTLLIHRVLGADSGTVNTVVTVPSPTPLVCECMQ